MSQHSNIESVAAQLGKLGDCLDFTRGLGEEVLSHIAVKISDRARSEEGPDGEWAANKGNYGERKRKKGLPVGKGLKDSSGARMLSLQQIQGEKDIQPLEASMSFGTDPAAKRKAEWFTAGFTEVDGCEPSGAPGQPPRPFYKTTPEDESEVRVMAAKAVEEFIGGL